MNVTIDTAHATFRAEPLHGRPVTFEVTLREIDVRQRRTAWGRNMQQRYVVQLKGSTGDGFAHFTSFEAACRSALARARKYERAFDKPRGIAARPVLSVVT